TNAISGSIGQGTGGVTESLKERVIMPLTGLYKETDHVLGHELGHSFQYDLALSREDTTVFAFNYVPLWLVEGTAEYLSVGRDDPHTAMWLRDAALRDDLPTMDQLTRSNRYFPYRYGQAYMAYIGGKYGDTAVANIFKLSGQVGLDSALVYTIGLKPDSLSNEWIQTVKDTYLPMTEGRVAADSTGRAVLNKELSGGDMNISPSISPDGKWIAFLSERDVFNINLFIADAETGKVVKRLKGSNSDPHFDAIRFINSSGSWSPDGRKFVFVTFVEGDNELSILDWNSGGIERRISVDGVTAMSNPAWSPDGESIVFTGLDGGISDLYLLNLQTNAVRQLTNDRFGDLQPAWSPDGKTIAFVSDRGPNGTDFEKLQYADVRLAFYDLETDEIRTVVPFDTGMSTNPQFSPDGRSVYFIADHDGFKDVYRYSLDNENVYRVTEIATGVSGITSLSPAMSVASQSGRLVFSVFSENKYSVFALEQDELEGTIVDPLQPIAADARLLPPASALYSGLVGNYLTDPTTGLPDADYTDAENYGARLKLDYVAPPTVGVTTGGPFGTGVAGGIGLFFSDMLGNHNLTVVAQANGTFKDIGGQVAYLNQKNRLNYGGSIAHIPYLIASSIPYDSNGDNFIDGIDLIKQRIFVDQVDVLGSYPFSTTKRFDLSAGFVRYGFSFEVDRFDLTGFGERERFDLEAPDPVYFAQAGAAYIGDFSVNGFTSPVSGGRYRLSLTPAIGSETFLRALVDYRRYRHFKPITVAVRGLHLGNYFADEDPTNPSLFTQEYLGYSNSMTFVRGYSFSSFDPNEDFSFNNLLGSRIAVASAEVRIPLLGTKNFGILNFPYLPTEVSFFADGGLAWTKEDGPNFEFSRRPQERSPVVSTGVSTRFNMFGYTVLEFYYAYPWQRPDKGAHFGFQIIPGW
ncbi:MAG: peptidase S9, partial [Rhodothermales bacterium]|nr:peptidase S9 [Rhodothermales bacterium]